MLTGATTTGRTRSLAGSLSVVSLALAASYAAVLVVLLPHQVAGIDPGAGGAGAVRVDRAQARDLGPALGPPVSCGTAARVL